MFAKAIYGYILILKISTPVSKDGWEDKQNVAYTYNGILFNLKKEGHSDTCYTVHGP